MMPALLAALGVVALAMFAQIERELALQLKRTSALQVHVSEFVAADMAASMIHVHNADEIMWSKRLGEGSIRYTSQMLKSARFEDPGDRRTIPIFSGSLVRSAGPGELDNQNPPEVQLLSRREPHYSTKAILLSGMKTRAMTDVMPAWVERLSGSAQVALVPEDMAHPMKRGGYIHHMLVDLPTIADVERFVTEVQAYARADRRQVTVTSAVDILNQLERIQGIQNVVRRLLVAGCCLILALTLGSIAWLEYRQDSYLMALLRSFGTPSFILFIHALLENLLLVMAGIITVLLSWKPLYEAILSNLDAVGFEVVGAPSLPSQDLVLILIGGMAGVLLAMLPIAYGLRKPPGYTLQ